MFDACTTMTHESRIGAEHDASGRARANVNHRIATCARRPHSSKRPESPVLSRRCAPDPDAIANLASLLLFFCKLSEPSSPGQVAYAICPAARLVCSPQGDKVEGHACVTWTTAVWSVPPQPIDHASRACEGVVMRSIAGAACGASHATRCPRPSSIHSFYPSRA